jgi:RES domain-containing protein
MPIWRISNHLTLDGGGGLKVAGRWHSRGRRVVYAARTPAAALLEMLVHLEIDVEDFPARFRLIEIEVADGVSCERIEPLRLPPDWTKDSVATRALGDDWLRRAAAALLEVPSALAPETWNVLINPAHADAAGLRVASVRDHPLDPRLR